jgi:hypothetical protein
MRGRSFVLMVFIASLALVLAACDTASSDDEVVEAADDSAVEAVDDTSDDGAEDEVVTESDDTSTEATDDTDVDATDDEAIDDAVDDSDAVATEEPATEESDDSSTQAEDDTTEEAALDDEEFEAVLAALGFESAEEAEAPSLDTETLTAETPEMTLQATAYDNTYVGDITEELLIAVSLDSMYADQAEGISAYVCDGDEVGFYVTGEIDDDGTATIQLAENAQLVFTINGETISGSVTMNEEELGSFEATEATGDAGFYVAEETVEGTDVAARWIVLDDGRQAGQMCIGIWARGVCIGVYVSRN